MGWQNGVPGALLNGGPPANYAAAAAASTAAQSICVGASGNFYLPEVPVGFWPIGQGNGNVMGVLLGGIVTASTTSTTATITVGVNSSVATAGGASAPTTTVLYTSPALTMTSTTANLGWYVSLSCVCRGAGYGTTATSTSIETEGFFLWSSASQCGNATAQPITNIDASVPQYLWATVTFSTSSATNSMTCRQFSAIGYPA